MQTVMSRVKSEEVQTTSLDSRWKEFGLAFADKPKPD